MHLLSSLYGGIARRRRRWYDTHPTARRQLARPVVSVGSLSVGGSGKTPVVAYIAELLIAAGERPAVLSRGYARQDRADGIVVVRDASGLRADLSRAGDEPMMLARKLDGTAVVVSPDRYLAGRFAEARLGCSVHLLDDGFQHLQLERQVDLLVMDTLDLDNSCVLPLGRLREPIDTAARADALLVAGATSDDAERAAASLRVSRAFGVRRSLGTARMVESSQSGTMPTVGARVVAVAGVARPERFFADVRATGVTLVRELGFSDHHPFSRRDIDRIASEVRTLRVDCVLTTEKDLVRLLPHRPLPFPLAWIPLVINVEPESEFRAWLLARVASARTAHADA